MVLSDLYTQDYGYYAGGQGARVYQNAQRNDFFGEPTTTQYGSRPSSQRRNNDESEFSPGLLDLHSFDTEVGVFWLNAGVFRCCIHKIYSFMKEWTHCITLLLHQTIFSKTSLNLVSISQNLLQNHLTPSSYYRKTDKLIADLYPNIKSIWHLSLIFSTYYVIFGFCLTSQVVARSRLCLLRLQGIS